MGSGGATGVGLAEGRQKFFFLPEPYTDFILAIVGEEVGFAGVSALVAAFLVLLWRGLRAAARAPDIASFLLAAGFTLVIVGRAALNAAVVTGLIPATGVPLPFLSYGGTSTLTTAFAVGVVLSVSRQAVVRESQPRLRQETVPWRA
jgi:cell division protein FtsW